MGRSIRFPSLARGHEIGYLLHSSAFEYGFRVEPLLCVAPWAGVYRTFGDGDVQHSPDTCTPIDYLGDYLASLTTFCLDSRNEDALDIAAGHWRSLENYNERTKRGNILKARQVRFKEGKARYVMARELAVSSADSRRHDRRWHPIFEWMDGSPSAVFGLLCMDGAGVYGLERYLILRRIADAFFEDDGSWTTPEEHFDRFKGQPIRSAFEAFECLMTAHENRKRVAPCLEAYGRDVARVAATAPAMS